MKVHRIELMVIDHDELGAESVCETIENQRYPNRCIHPKVMSAQTRDIGDWQDENPLNSNNINRNKAAFDALFDQ